MNLTFLTNQNLAYIQDTARVTAGGDVDVNANQYEFAVTITGSTTNEAPIGVGIAVGVNIFTNDTRAFIGNVNATASPLLIGFVESGGNVSVTANTQETDFGTAFSGVIANGAEQHNSSGGSSSGSSAPTSITQGNPVANVHKSAGVAISGASVVFDMHDDDTKAYITGGVLVVAPDTLTVKASSNLLLMNVSGVLAVQSDENSTSNIAIAGGFSDNELEKDSSGNERDVEAYVGGSTIIDAVHTVVDAEQSAKVWTFAAGAAGSRPEGDKSVAIFGSVPLNLVNMNTIAGLLNGTVLKPTSTIVPEDVSVTSNSNFSLVSAAGGISVAGKAGIGAGIDVGVENINSIASIGPNAVIEPTGNVTVVSHGTEKIISLGVSLAIGTKDLGIAGAGSSQNLTTDIEAYIAPGSTVETSGSILLDAYDDITDYTIGGG